MERVKHNRGIVSFLCSDGVSTVENADYFLAVRYSSSANNGGG